MAGVDVGTACAPACRTGTFSKLKAHLRKAADRTIHGLWNAIGRILDLYSPNECANFFANCGYDAD